MAERYFSVNIMRVYLSEDIAEDKTGPKISIGGGRHYSGNAWHDSGTDTYFLSSTYFELRERTSDGNMDLIGSASDIDELVQLLHNNGVNDPSDVHNHNPGVYDVAVPPDGNNIYESDLLSGAQRAELDTRMSASVVQNPVQSQLF